MRELEPRGVDCAFDAVGGANIGLCIRATRRGGTVVGYGFMGVKGTVATLAMSGNLLLGARLRRRRGAFYGITMLYRKNPKPLREDLPKIFALIAEKKLDPLVSVTLPLGEAKNAMEMRARGRWRGRLCLQLLRPAGGPDEPVRFSGRNCCQATGVNLGRHPSRRFESRRSARSPNHWLRRATQT